jgi:type IV secretion system protein VirB4
MVGPTGSGKSSLLALITAQWFRYPNAQVFGFDKGHSLYALTRAAGGEFYEPARDAEQGFSLQPLAHLDTDSDIAWANEWLETLCALQNCPVGPRERSLLAAAIRLLASSPRRTMTELRANVQDQRIREALEPYVLGGSLGNLLDGEAEGIRKGRLVTFELGSLMQMGEKAVSAVLPYLFRRIIRQVEHGSGEPTLVVVDEAWVALKHERFRDAIREWLRTLRKYNGAVVLVTQSLSDVFTSPIRDVILESCLTKILLPNAEAGNPASREHYAQLGLGEREIEMIAGAMPKRDYYCVSQAGRRMITLRLGPVALAFCGANSAEERARVDVFASRWGARWPAEWLRSRGLSDQAVEMEMETVC